MGPMDVTVGEIRTYPARPEGFEEPLFHTRRSRKEILEHFAKSGWLCQASEIEPRVVGARRGGVGRRRRATGGRPAGRGDRVGRVLSSWREVDRWWEPGGGVDLVWRVLQGERGGQTVRAETLQADPPRES